MWEENLGTQAGVHLIGGCPLIWGPLNTGSLYYSTSTIMIMVSRGKGEVGWGLAATFDLATFLVWMIEDPAKKSANHLKSVTSTYITQT